MDIAPLRPVIERFGILGDIVSIGPYGTGHINDTYAITANQAGTQVRYILQRINTSVFRDPARLMDNIVRVTTHYRTHLSATRVADRGAASENDISRRALTVIPTVDRQSYHVGDDGHYWRMYLFIEGARTYDVVESPDQAYEAARAFGEFQTVLVDLPGPRLFETIPGFHDTRKRFAALTAAVERDPLDRAASARDAIEFAVKRESDCSRLLDLFDRGEIPERITHNDTKLNNVMIDDATGKGLCVIDLDTVMPGLALYDFGDLVRTSTSGSAEDERDLGKIEMRMPMFRALARGYVEGTGSALTALERDLLPFSGKLITLENGIRFLTDFLEGDVYFRTHRPGQNLDRCRTQFALVRSIEAQLDEMKACVVEAHDRRSAAD